MFTLPPVATPLPITSPRRSRLNAWPLNWDGSVTCTQYGGGSGGGGPISFLNTAAKMFGSSTIGVARAPHLHRRIAEVVPEVELGAGGAVRQRRDPVEPQLAVDQRVARPLPRGRSLAREDERQQRVGEAERDLGVGGARGIARVAEGADRSAVRVHERLPDERGLVVVEGRARAVDAHHHRQHRAVGQSLNVGRAVAGRAPAIGPAVVAVDHHEAALVPGGRHLRAGAVPPEPVRLQ